MKFRVDKGTGYMYSYAPSHPAAQATSGKLMEHHYVMVNHIGRLLREDECVHHKNRDKTDNRLENLQLMTLTAHAELHAAEDRGVLKLKKTCPVCSKVFIVTSGQDHRVNCSISCKDSANRRFNITAAELEALVWQMPVRDVAKRLGVSDVAVHKRCARLGVNKPPIGYWLSTK